VKITRFTVAEFHSVLSIIYLLWGLRVRRNLDQNQYKCFIRVIIFSLMKHSNQNYERYAVI